jgi:hypothetical protein
MGIYFSMHGSATCIKILVKKSEEKGPHKICKVEGEVKYENGNTIWNVFFWLRTGLRCRLSLDTVINCQVP